ncbi:hypothetical protein HME9304_00230 [Flagellimonas maritima]|uniref:Uncharacterized protein n=1 Tax=Flagellimonas maritima TaxID=1383885 RepID=A0A2Z4LNC2_9FLAO|nr:hypothetical protein [Allomuricauda aurantiaca]AWX43243.1 hypothetical protein HME9304_00230 [Allomuricauda aurantiaca]
MKIVKLISYMGLVLTLVPSFLVFMQAMELELYKNLMLLGTLIWCATAPFWVNKSKVK